MTLMFAYGSNLNLSQMACRAPAAEALGRFALRDHQLVFRYVADVIPRKGAVVEGGLWRITPDCERSLDRYEGYPRLYRKSYVNTRVGRHWATVMFYRMNARDIAPPQSSYCRAIAVGYNEWGIPLDTLFDAVRRSWTEHPLVA